VLAISPNAGVLASLKLTTSAAAKNIHRRPAQPGLAGRAAKMPQRPANLMLHEKGQISFTTVAGQSSMDCVLQRANHDPRTGRILVVIFNATD
jgi:hypothetical protein